MFDRLIRKQPDWARLPGIQVVAIDNIAEKISESGNISFGLPGAMPLFPFSFVEFTVPPALRRPGLYFPSSIGTLVASFNDELGRHRAAAQVFIENREGIGMVNEDQEPIRFSFTPDGFVAAIGPSEASDMEKIRINYNEDLRGYTEDEANQKRRAKFLALGIALTLTAFAFAHCKNVTTKEHEPNPATVKSYRKKRRPLPFRYYTLEIDQSATPKRSGSNSEQPTINRPKHLCRGHFATYSPERPLFGRVSGTFWIPGHVRGGDASRCVVKDYSVGREPSAPTSDYSDAAARFPAGTQVVYFLQAESGGPIKIGETSNLQQRMKDLQQAEPLKLLHAFPGDRDCEQWIHRELSQHRRLGEWFDPHANVFNLIEEAKRLDFKSTTEARERFIPLRIREAQCAYSTAPTCT